jgi:hypothetical protein
MGSVRILLILVSVARRVVFSRRFYSHVLSMMWVIMSVIVGFIFMHLLVCDSVRLSDVVKNFRLYVNGRLI